MRAELGCLTLRCWFVKRQNKYKSHSCNQQKSANIQTQFFVCQCDEIAAAAAAALPLISSVYTYLYRGEEHFKARRPHRKKLNPGITDDIIELLNESTVCVGRGALQQDGIIQQDHTEGQRAYGRVPIVSKHNQNPWPGG